MVKYIAVKTPYKLSKSTGNKMTESLVYVLYVMYFVNMTPASVKPYGWPLWFLKGAIEVKCASPPISFFLLP